MLRWSGLASPRSRPSPGRLERCGSSWPLRCGVGLPALQRPAGTPGGGGRETVAHPFGTTGDMMFLSSCAGCNAPGDTLCRRCRFALVSAPAVSADARRPCGHAVRRRRPIGRPRPEVPQPARRRSPARRADGPPAAPGRSAGRDRPGHLGAHQLGAHRRARLRPGGAARPGRRQGARACRAGGCCTAPTASPQSGARSRRAAARAGVPGSCAAPRPPGAAGRRRGHHRAPRCTPPRSRCSTPASPRCGASPPPPRRRRHRCGRRRAAHLQLAS